MRTSPTSNTNKSGVAKFVLLNMPPGEYKLCVEDVVKADFDYLSSNNTVTCDTLTVP